MLYYPHMVHRGFWTDLIERAWERHNVVWLAGVRRVGKTYLCQGLEGVSYYDCELPSTRRLLEDSQAFLNDHRGSRVVIDEVHRLPNPSELLKVAADHYTDVRLIATGSSTFGASSKFRDTLAGRKREIWLTPMTGADLVDFGRPEIARRFLRGGLPPFFLDEGFPEREYQEWIDAYWAKDIQELFRLERRHSFTRFAELLFIQSGGIFEASKFARPCEVSRSTITNYLSVMEATYLAHIIRPYNSRKSTEIVSAPKVYAFDTGFVCYHKGVSQLRNDDMGPLWEHYVLNEINARLQTRNVLYWRDKRGHEVDFVIAPRGAPPIAIECKWSAGDADPRGILAFRKNYPEGANLVVTRDVLESYSREYDGTTVRFCGLEDLFVELLK